jgi:hypothetical protein
MRRSILPEIPRQRMQLPFLTVALFVLNAMAPAAGAKCNVYRVNVQGNTSIGDANATLTSQPFWVTQYAIWCERGINGNPLEFWMTSFKDLNASPNVGQVEIMTNSAFARNAGMQAARFTLARVTQVQGGFTFELDYGMSFQMPPPNVFISPGYASVPGGLGGLCFLNSPGLCDLVTSPAFLSVSYMVPRSGGGNFNFPNGDGFTIAGGVEIVGSAADNPNFQGRYQASFSGNYLGSFEYEF